MLTLPPKNMLVQWAWTGPPAPAPKTLASPVASILFQQYIYSAFRIRPNSPVRYKTLEKPVTFIIKSLNVKCIEI